MYYKIAYELQVKEVLPEGCSSVLYERTVQAFLHYILPNLAQSLDDEDAARHIVNKMPAAEQARRPHESNTRALSAV